MLAGVVSISIRTNSSPTTMDSRLWSMWLTSAKYAVPSVNMFATSMPSAPTNAMRVIPAMIHSIMFSAQRKNCSIFRSRLAILSIFS